jgi:hypothetical protein
MSEKILSYTLFHLQRPDHRDRIPVSGKVSPEPKSEPLSKLGTDTATLRTFQNLKLNIVWKKREEKEQKRKNISKCDKLRKKKDVDVELLRKGTNLSIPLRRLTLKPLLKSTEDNTG